MLDALPDTTLSIYLDLFTAISCSFSLSSSDCIALNQKGDPLNAFLIIDSIQFHLYSTKPHNNHLKVLYISIV